MSRAEYFRDYERRTQRSGKRGEYWAEYYARPDVKAKRKAYRARADVRLRLKLKKAGIAPEIIAAEVAKFQAAQVQA